MQEIELKILVDEEAVRRLRRNTALKEMVKESAATEQLLSVYYDTNDRLLAAQGIALRLRKEGRDWTQTIKGAKRHRGGVSEVDELNSDAPGGRVDLDAIPDETFKAAIIEILNGQALNPVYSTDMRRTTWNVQLGDGLVEIALDIGSIVAGERKAPLREVELELKAGHPRAIFAVAKRLFPSGGLTFSHLSKAKRCQLLADTGEVVRPPAPRNAKRVEACRSDAVEVLARDCLAECLEQVADNFNALRHTDDPEAAHQLRVGLRRLRSAMSVFGPVLASPMHRHLAGEARWLGQEVGRLRDLEVAQIDILAPEREKYPDEIGFEALDAALTKAIVAERKRLRALLIATRAQTFLLDLTEFVAVRGWLDPLDLTQSVRLAKPVGEYAVPALDKAFKKAIKRAKTIGELTIDERHELRKELKKLRYTVEFLRPIFTNDVADTFIKALKKLQNVFGDLNDAAMAEDLFGPESSFTLSSVNAARAAGRLIGARLERADHTWHEAHGRWNTLLQVGPFWREEIN